MEMLGGCTGNSSDSGNLDFCWLQWPGGIRVFGAIRSSVLSAYTLNRSGVPSPIQAGIVITGVNSWPLRWVGLARDKYPSVPFLLAGE